MSISSNNKIYRKTIISNSKKLLKDNLPTFSDILSIPSNPEDIFTLINPIGHGAFGSVYKAIHKKTNKVYAIKIIQYFKDEPILLSNIKHMENINFCYKTVQEETSLMRLVNSSNYIVKYYGSYFSRQTNTLWLILEFCDSGSVIDLMLAMDRTYTEIEIATIMKMVLKGLILIHEKNLIHRDVKGANILLSGDGVAKLGDFGVGVQLKEDFRKSKKGSPYWMSPQVVNNECYGVGTDIWSLGVTCLELYNGEPPNSCLKPNEVMEKIGKCEINFDELFGENKKNMSEYFINFIKKCLVIDEKKRAKAKELINDEFIVQYSKDNKILEELYKNHIRDLDEYRKEVEEYEQEMKAKQKKEYEKRLLIQKQKEQQNLSIECDMDLPDINNKEEMNKDNNVEKSIEDEIIFNKSISSLFFGNFNENNKNDELDSQILINDDFTNTLSKNNSFKLCENHSHGFNTPNLLKSTKVNNNIFNDDFKNVSKEKYNDIYSNNINSKKIYNLSSDLVNIPSNLYQKNDLICKSADVKEYTMESKISNKSCDKIRNNTTKNSGKKNNIKCRVINFNKPKPVISRQKDCINDDKILNKTMEDKRNLSLDINENLILSHSNTNKTKQDRKSMNLINNIKSLSILSNNKVLQNSKKKKEAKNKYRPLNTEDNINTKKISSFKNIIAKSAKYKQLKNPEIKDNKLNRTTTSNTYDNSNSKPNSNFNTNNNINNSKISNNLNTTNSIYTKKVYSQNLLIYNKENSLFNKNKNRIPVANRYIQSFGEMNYNNILDKNKEEEKNNKIQKNIKNIEIKNLNSYNDRDEDINDSDDDGIINKVKNFGDINDIKNNENKENINFNNILIKDKIIDNNPITNRSNHSYSVIESIEVIPSMNKNNIFSNAHKKYFS